MQLDIAVHRHLMKSFVSTQGSVAMADSLSAIKVGGEAP